MNKEELKHKLKRYNYKYKEQFDVIIVNLTPTLEIKIDYSEADRIIISDKLRGYNMLTGIWSMSVKTSIVFNTILSFVYALFFIFLNYSLNKQEFDVIIILLFVIGMCWLILWTNFYFVKAENFKTLIKSWDR